MRNAKMRAYRSPVAQQCFTRKPERRASQIRVPIRFATFSRERAGWRKVPSPWEKKEGRRPVLKKLLQKKPDRPRTNYLECAVTFRTGASRRGAHAKGY
ncbi:hypothetical protein [Paraburkholderia pallida]|uniref:Uncharacterized protein n=1 Tax=Paraburkholderia pallida TaxID=2547399 RepID=A0A4P7CPB9_9BURK|nr:hypothetical protein [Paraburkholderia pallida]QBQ97658.1 hypothetical protein E1956_11030 [Paraburkholderia pallida]